MNISSTIHYPVNEQLIGKFHVINVDKTSVNTHNNHDDIIIQTPSITDESGCASRFQMIRVDRNFGRGRWKVNDYEPPENTSMSIIPSVNTIETEPINIPNNSAFSNISTTMPTVITGDSNATSSATLAATAASAAAAAATAFQQQQQRMALNNTQTLVPTASVPPSGMIHAYPPTALPNQSYLLPNHHQFGYYTFFPPAYSHYASPWAAAAALAASNPYMPPPTLPSSQQQAASQLPPTANLNDPMRLADTVLDSNIENTIKNSVTISNPTTDHLQNAQLSAATSFLYALHRSHSPFLPQASATTSPYATIPSYHPAPPPPTIIPPNQPSHIHPACQIILPITIDTQQSHQASTFTSPKHDTTKNLVQQPSSVTISKTRPLDTTLVNGIDNDLFKTTHVDDLISSSPPMTTTQLAPPSLISPLTITTTNVPTTPLSDIWTYTTTGSSLNLTQTAQTAAVTAVAAMGLLNNENNQNTEIANEILKELTTPTKQNNTTDIDNKISAAMDLVKMHLLSAVREEVTELRQQIRILNEKINSIEHENMFLRQHVPNEIYAQYVPQFIGLSSNDSTNSTTTTISSIPVSSSSQTIPITSLSSNPSLLVQ